MRILGCIILFGLVLVSCSQSELIRDRLDTAVVVGVGRAPDKFPVKCLRNISVYTQAVFRRQECGELSWQVAPHEPAHLWTYAANSRNVEVPQPGKRLSLMVVDRDGAKVPDSHAVVEPEMLLTGPNGFSTEDIVLVAKRSGVYRIRVEYVDRSAMGYSYSPNIIVQTPS